MVKISDLSKKFKQNVVFAHLNLEIEDGELVHLAGINGSGKSTLFKMICGIEEPDSGKIMLKSGAQIGALIENPSYIENENILYNLKFLANLNGNYHEEYVQELCKMFELDLYSKTHLKNYSLGMRQKVGIIQSVMEDQDLILLDEPVRGLDDRAVITFTKLVKDLHEKGKTIVIASHDEITGLEFTRKLRIENHFII